MLIKKYLMLIVAILLLAACGGQQPKESVEVQITLTEFGIQSSLTEFETGIPYKFVVTNAGTVEHEFMIMPPLTSEDMGMAMDMGELDEMALAMIPGSELPAGATASIEFTFTKPASADELEFSCHTPGHYEANMRLPITVK